MQSRSGTGRILRGLAGVLALTLGLASGSTVAASEVVGAGVATAIPESNPYVIRMTARDYRWECRYPGADGEIGTADDVVRMGTLLLPADRAVRIELKSRDRIYSLHLPSLRMRQIAVPGLDHSLELPPMDAGEIAYRGDQFCGFSHDTLHGVAQVVPPEEWTRALREAKDAATRSPSRLRTYLREQLKDRSPGAETLSTPPGQPDRSG